MFQKFNFGTSEKSFVQLNRIDFLCLQSVIECATKLLIGFFAILLFPSIRKHLQ